MTLHQTRPFNLRYVVRDPGPDGQARRATHRTATCNYGYIMRRNLVDEMGPTPDFASRDDLVAMGRVAPKRAHRTALAGEALWRTLDSWSAQRRPDQATAAHMVASLPTAQDPVAWEHLVQAFAEEQLMSKGMIADWAIHYRAGDDDRPGIAPHAHMLVNLRMWDGDPGRRNLAWLATEASVDRLAEAWYQVSGMWPTSVSI